MKNLIGGFLIILLLSSCASIVQDLNPNTIYRHDMIIESDGKKCVGVCILKAAKHHKITITAAGKLDLFTFSTCHRTIVKEKAGEIFNNKRVVVNYDPVPTIEDSYCPVELGGFEKIKHRHSYGIIDFQDPEMKLLSTQGCDGKQSLTAGVGICQAKKGTIQYISFNEPVEWFNDTYKITTKNNKLLHYEMPRGINVIVFKSKSGKFHRLTTVGFEDIIIRGVN